MSNNLQKFSIFYSKYGYVKIDSSLYDKNNILPFETVSESLKGQINKAHLFSEITIKLKTLYGLRKQYTFTVKPEDKLNTLLTNLQKEEEKDKSLPEILNKKQTYRLISSKGALRELNMFRKVYEEKISMNQIIIIAPNHPLKFSDQCHGDQISIECGNVAYKSGGDDLQLALIDKGYNRDSSYTEFVLETEPDQKGIIIGVSLAREDYYLNDITRFWGYILSDANKIANDTQKEYGKICKLGDKIGVLLEFNETNNTLNISFFVNGENLGLAFEGLPKDTYYPAAVLYYEGTKVKVMEHSILPEEKK